MNKNENECKSRPSGALKRKLKKEREENLKKTNTVLDTFFTSVVKSDKSLGK